MILKLPYCHIMYVLVHVITRLVILPCGPYLTPKPHIHFAKSSTQPGLCAELVRALAMAVGQELPGLVDEEGLGFRV